MDVLTRSVVTKTALTAALVLTIGGSALAAECPFEKGKYELRMGPFRGYIEMKEIFKCNKYPFLNGNQADCFEGLFKVGTLRPEAVTGVWRDSEILMYRYAYPNASTTFNGTCGQYEVRGSSLSNPGNTERDFRMRYTGPF